MVKTEIIHPIESEKITYPITLVDNFSNSDTSSESEQNPPSYTEDLTDECSSVDSQLSFNPDQNEENEEEDATNDSDSDNSIATIEEINTDLKNSSLNNNSFRRKPKTNYTLVEEDDLSDFIVYRSKDKNQEEEFPEVKVPFEFQIAKTNRAKCVNPNCIEKIEKGAVKFCKIKGWGQSSHVKCITKKQKLEVMDWVRTIEELVGFELLKKGDLISIGKSIK
jgi:hypothetical protein